MVVSTVTLWASSAVAAAGQGEGQGRGARRCSAVRQGQAKRAATRAARQNLPPRTESAAHQAIRRKKGKKDGAHCQQQQAHRSACRCTSGQPGSRGQCSPRPQSTAARARAGGSRGRQGEGPTAASCPAADLLLSPLLVVLPLLPTAGCYAGSPTACLPACPAARLPLPARPAAAALLAGPLPACPPSWPAHLGDC